MNVLVKVAYNEDLLIISDRLASEEFLGLLEGRVVLHDLIGLCIEHEAVRYPTVVAAEDQNLRVISQSKAAHCVSSGPLLVLVN